MSEPALVVSVVVASVLMMLTVALAIAPDPLPQKIVEPSPVAGCREYTGGYHWAPPDSTIKHYICPLED